jgi:D-glycero-D-manno-heptose 1,7-bisphosphate phosphatase
MKPCVFLDRDGVLNRDRPDYVYRLSHLDVLPGVPESLYRLKASGFLLVVITNQGGIARGLYSERQMRICHIALQQACDNVIDRFYFSPHHPSRSASLSRKPGTLMFEKAIARFDIYVRGSWMVGDRNRDILPAKSLGIRTILIGDEADREVVPDLRVMDLSEATDRILALNKP